MEYLFEVFSQHTMESLLFIGAIVFFVSIAVITRDR